MSDNVIDFYDNELGYVPICCRPGGRCTKRTSSLRRSARIGDITLCKHCNLAIQLERTKYYGDCWMHFTPDIWRKHTAEPKTVGFIAAATQEEQ